jgi:hypothetical protein
VCQQCLSQGRPRIGREAEASEKLCLADSFGMIGREKVINHLGLFDTSVGGVRKIHCASD